MNKSQRRRKQNNEGESTVLDAQKPNIEHLGETILTTRELSRALKVTERTVQNLVSRGDIQPIRIGRCVRFRLSDVFRALGIQQ